LKMAKISFTQFVNGPKVVAVRNFSASRGFSYKTRVVLHFFNHKII